MKKILLLMLALLLAAGMLLIPAILRQPEELVVSSFPGGNAWCIGDAPLYREPGDTKTMAILPAVTRVLWLASTEDYAYGCVEAMLNGEMVMGYVPWLDLQGCSTGTERAWALTYLKRDMGWTQEELDAYRMSAPMLAQRNQFACVSVISGTYPRWRYDVWVDYLNGGGLHDIQTPFTGSLKADEAAVRNMLRSGRLTTAEEVRAYFLSCYGPEESWSPALAEWVADECAKLASSGAA